MANHKSALKRIRSNEVKTRVEQVSAQNDS